MKRSMCMFLLAAMMTTAAVAFAAKSPFSKERIGGCNSVCRTDQRLHQPTMPNLRTFLSRWSRSIGLVSCFLSQLSGQCWFVGH